MKQVARRVAGLEQKKAGPSVVHTVRVPCGGDEKAALDDYGREKVRPHDLVVCLTTFG